MPAGTGSARDFYDRHAGRFVYAYASTARNFERHLLFVNGAYTRVGGAVSHDLGGRYDYWGLDETDLFNTMELTLERLEEVELYAAAHKCTFFETSITWCGKLYSQGQTKHDPERLTHLVTMRRPETAGELMHFLQAVDWLRTFAAHGRGCLSSSCFPGGASGGP